MLSSVSLRSGRALCSILSSHTSSSTITAATATCAVKVRCMSSKKDEGMQVRRAGGVKLDSEEGDIKTGRPLHSDPSSSSSSSPPLKEGNVEKAFSQASAEDREAAQRMREAMRESEQVFRERQLNRHGIKVKSEFRVKQMEQLVQKKERVSSANKYNPILLRTRSHLDQNDLPPSFDFFSVPPLSADEVDSKTRTLHAAYWSKYNAWKDARPTEYQAWLKRLEKREQEQDYFWQQSQLNSPRNIKKLKQQNVEKLLPKKNKADFATAVQSDPDLASAVEKLGEEEVLRRWSAYQCFLEAEIDSETKMIKSDQSELRAMHQAQTLAAEDPIRLIHDTSLNLTLGQKKRIYNLLLGAKKKANEEPYWLHPDPRYEGEHDWKMADSFVKPPLLPPMNLLKYYSAHPDINSNFSSLHRFLHFERLRQTIHFLRVNRKSQIRTTMQTPVDCVAVVQQLVAKTKNWSDIKAKYPFLTDALYQAATNMFRSQWAQRDQQDFMVALHRNVLDVAKLLDMHFSRGKSKDSWILSYPMTPNTNPDEVLRAMPVREYNAIEAQMLADKMMQIIAEGRQVNKDFNGKPRPLAPGVTAFPFKQSEKEQTKTQ